MPQPTGLKVTQQVQATLIRIGHKALQSKVASGPDPREEDQVPGPQCPQAQQETEFHIPRIPPDRAAPLYHRDTHKIRTWALQAFASDAMAVPVSWPQLFMAYVLATEGQWKGSQVAPVQKGKPKRWRPAGEATGPPPPFSEQAKAFARYMRSVWLHCSRGAQAYHVRAIQYWQSCIVVRIRATVLHEVDKTFLALGPPCLCASDLAVLLPAGESTLRNRA